MKRIYFLVFTFFAVPDVLPQDVSVTVDKQRIYIGEQIQVSLQAGFLNDQPRGWFDLDTIPHFEILQASAIDSQVIDDRLIKRQTVTITSWDTGQWMIPAYSFGAGRTKPIPVRVTFSPMNPAQPYHDIKDILEVQIPEDYSSTWWWYFVGLVLLVAIIFLIFSDSQEKKEETRPLSMEDIYRNALQKLEKLDPREDPKLFYTALINIFRDYLEQRKNIRSFSKTTEDLTAQLRSVRLSQEQFHQLVHVLQESDLVKYAKYQPDKEKKHASVEVIRKNIISIEQMR